MGQWDEAMGQKVDVEEAWGDGPVSRREGHSGWK